MANETPWLTTGVKPLSANKMHYGQKTDTRDYKQYQLEVRRNLPDLDITEGPLCLHLQACFSNRGADLDNVLKPFLDTLQKRYGFNDNKVYKLIAHKRIVKKGEETIHFKILTYKGDA